MCEKKTMLLHRLVNKQQFFGAVRISYYWVTSSQSHLVGLRRLMEHPGIDGCCHQVIGCGDGMNVTSQMEVELKGKTDKKGKNEER